MFVPTEALAAHPGTAPAAQHRPDIDAAMDPIEKENLSLRGVLRNYAREGLDKDRLAKLADLTAYRVHRDRRPFADDVLAEFHLILRPV